MTRTTIDFGIDLGTTNSAVAIFNGSSSEIIKNNEDHDITPSAVYLSKRHGIEVGRRAKRQLANDDECNNAFIEFKGRMGEATDYIFARDGQKTSPENLSSEVLKSLRSDTESRLNELPQAAVITLPAAFKLPQCDATQRAARLAGITISPLLQEPIAAAMAYGFHTEVSRARWLVYDLGGGTFDAAIIQVRDGAIRVINHGGDNNLGGKLIDWAIVDQVLVPYVTREYKLRDFHRNNERYKAAFYKLKFAAEEAKIMLSRREVTPFYLDTDSPWYDEDGRRVDLDLDLSRHELAALAEPTIARSINICRRVIEQKKMSASDIEKVLLVGGPTLAPFLRSHLADACEGLGVPLEFRVDPLTIVARGAAVFAGTQIMKLPTSSMNKAAQFGQYRIELDYKPVGLDVDPEIGGKVFSSDGEPLSDFTLEFINAESRPAWRSGKLRLAADGTFLTTLWAEEGKRNYFQIELRDVTGKLCAVEPQSIPYTFGITVDKQTLTHNVGIALKDNTVMTLFEKGEPLPARKTTRQLQTTVDLQRGRPDQYNRIPVVEGEFPKADRNELIGSLKIGAVEIKRDLPAGTDMEITLEMDESRGLRIEAYIDALGQEFEASIDYEVYGKVDLEEVEDDFEFQQKRLEQAEQKAWEIDHAGAQRLLQKIEDERSVEEVENSLAAVQTDPDAAGRANHRLTELKGLIDEVEDAMEWSVAKQEAEDAVRSARQVLARYGNDDEKESLTVLEKEIREAIERVDLATLKENTDKVWGLEFRTNWRRAEFVSDLFYYLESRKAIMNDSRQADMLFAEGGLAMRTGDFPKLQSVVANLYGLLPADRMSAQERAAHGSTVISSLLNG